MHRHCLSCSADLGSNDVVETLPLGRRLAFDSWQGRLWLVCPRCRRWNLAPIEERWEPVEALEKLFRDARLRVHSENIGLARLADGTTLIRIGDALQGELAAWRYGSELRRRRWKNLALAGTFGAIATGVVLGGFGGLAMVGIPAGLGNFAIQAIFQTTNIRRRRRIICQLDGKESPTGEPLLVRRLHLDGAVLSHEDDGAPLLWAPGLTASTLRTGWQRSLAPERMKIWQLARGPVPSLHGPTAVRAMTRAMVDTNTVGATAAQVADALHLIELAGGADAFIRSVVSRDPLLAWKRPNGLVPGPYAKPRVQERRMADELPPAVRKHALSGDTKDALGRIEALALEMALHDERERRALQGELETLAEEWREAEMLARIADALPGDVDPASESVSPATSTAMTSPGR